MLRTRSSLTLHWHFLRRCSRLDILQTNNFKSSSAKYAPPLSSIDILECYNRLIFAMATFEWTLGFNVKFCFSLLDNYFCHDSQENWNETKVYI